MRAKLTVYRVEQCGYYAAGAEAATCSDLRKCLADIHEWIHGVRPTISATRTFNESEDGSFLPVYCFAVAQRGQNDYLLTTWNETPSDDGAVGAVGRDETAGEADVQTTNLPADSIVGYGTHFWFLPDLARLVTVRFDAQPLNGHVGLNLYIRGFLERFSPHVRFDPAVMEGDVFVRPVIGYALDNDAEEADDGLRPRFKSLLLRRDGEITYIRQHRAQIKKVIRKGRPTAGGPATRTVLDRVLTFMGARPNDRALPDKNFTFEIAYTPTQDELRNIITRWQAEDHETWDDIGFDISGDDTRRWLSSSTLKTEVDLPDSLHAGAASVAPAEALLQALREHRAFVSA
jgi:hypothetical protein